MQLVFSMVENSLVCSSNFSIYGEESKIGHMLLFRCFCVHEYPTTTLLALESASIFACQHSLLIGQQVELLVVSSAGPQARLFKIVYVPADSKFKIFEGHHLSIFNLFLQLNKSLSFE